MSTVQNPADAGKETDPTINPLTEILSLLRGIGTRFDIPEQRFEYLDRDVLKAIDAESIAVTDAEPDPPRIPTLALMSDGRMLLSLHYVTGVELPALAALLLLGQVLSDEPEPSLTCWNLEPAIAA
jgi:hypothetical protein